jgi:ABC-type uncharacterized transport system ATPase subunit
VSILLIEHDMRLVMSLAERLYVLNFVGLLPRVRRGRFKRTSTSSTPTLGTAVDEETA